MQWGPYHWRKHLIIPLWLLARNFSASVIHLGAQHQQHQQVWGIFFPLHICWQRPCQPRLALWGSQWTLTVCEGGSVLANTSCSSQKWTSQIGWRHAEILPNLHHLQVLVINYSWDNPADLWAIGSPILSPDGCPSSTDGAPDKPRPPLRHSSLLPPSPHTNKQQKSQQHCSDEWSEP